MSDPTLRPPDPPLVGSSATPWWRTTPRAVLRQVLMLEDTPHSIALGTAIGMFIGMTPTVGIQMLLVIVTALICAPFFRFNRVAAILTVYISNPVTMIPLYWMNYKVGTLFVSGNVSRERFAQIFHYEGLSEWCSTIVSLVVEVGWPLLIGSFVVATVSGLATYPLMRWLLASFRRPPAPATAEAPETPEAGPGEPPAACGPAVAQTVAVSRSATGD